MIVLIGGDTTYRNPGTRQDLDKCICKRNTLIGASFRNKESRISNTTHRMIDWRCLRSDERICPKCIQVHFIAISALGRHIITLGIKTGNTFERG